jgi:hypothetical protein
MLDVEQRISEILSEKLNLLKDYIMVSEARVKVIKARIRGGKVQRRKKVSNVKGYTLRGGKLKRMSSKERLDRKIGARKAKLKRKATAARALIKRKRSLAKRKAMGL